MLGLQGSLGNQQLLFLSSLYLALVELPDALVLLLEIVDISQFLVIGLECVPVLETLVSHVLVH